MNDKVVLGDCLTVMKDLPDDCVDSIVCDPPAGIAFMGKEWDTDKGGRHQWVAWMESIARECLRVLKPGGYALVWAMPRTSHWTGWAWENAGWEPRDKIVHLFGSGFPKSLDVSKAIDKSAGAERAPRNGTDNAERGSMSGSMNNRCQTCDKPFFSADPCSCPRADKVAVTDAARQWDGWGTALKPAAEDWWLFRKPLSEGTVAANVLKHGTGGINIDGCRIETSENLNGGAYKSKAEIEDNEEDSYQCIDPNCPDAATMPYHDHPAEKRKGRHDGAENWRYKHGGAGGFEQPKGRWPANVILDEEAAALLDEQTAGKMHGAGAAIQRSHTGDYAATSFDMSGARPLTRFGDSGGASRFFYVAKASRSERTHGGTVENKHPTVKPISLMRYLVRLVTPPGGSVLDPFCGSGSTLVAAELEGFDYLGIEQDPESHKTACERLANAEVLRKKTDPKTTQVATDEEP
jgi:site-specific DNA-methyltransferase (adenine-specific)